MPTPRSSGAPAPSLRQPPFAARLGRVLADARRRAGLSQVDLGHALLLSPRTIRRIEHGVAGSVSAAVIEAWERACGLRLDVVASEDAA